MKLGFHSHITLVGIRFGSCGRSFMAKPCLWTEASPDASPDASPTDAPKFVDGGRLAKCFGQLIKLVKKKSYHPYYGDFGYALFIIVLTTLLRDTSTEIE